MEPAIWNMDGPQIDELSFDPLCIKTEPEDTTNDITEESEHILCPICSRRFVISMACQLHCKYKHGVLLDDNMQYVQVIESTQKRKYKCKDCSKSYFHKSSLKYHQQSHKKTISVNKKLTSKLSCISCGKNMRKIDLFLKHVKTCRRVRSDGTRVMITCPYCSMEHKLHSSLVKHIREEHQAETNKIHSIGKKNNPQTRKSNSPQARKKYVKCISITCKCGLRFASRSEYQSHRYSAHFSREKRGKVVKRNMEHAKPRQTYACEFCDVLLESAPKLVTHIQYHHSGMVCDTSELLQNLPGSVASSNQGASSNQSTDSVTPNIATKKPVKLSPNAKKALQYSPNAMSKQVSPQTSKTVEVSPPPSAVNGLENRYTWRDSMFYCNFCLKSYPAVSSMVKHIRNMHLPDEPLPEKSKKTFHCGFCYKNFESERALRVHEKYHMSNNSSVSETVVKPKSSDGHKSTNTKQKISTASAKISEVQCVHCKEFFLQSELANHLKLHKMVSRVAHTSNKNFINSSVLENKINKQLECTSNKYNNVSVLMDSNYQVVKAKADSTEKSKCAYCEKYFLNSELLNHLMLHKVSSGNAAIMPNTTRFPLTNFKPTLTAPVSIKKYLCDFCGKTLLSKIAIEFHVQRSHLDTMYNMQGPRFQGCF
jgi:hypothetical protein